MLAAEWHARRAPRSPAYLLDWLAGRLDGRRRRPAPIVGRSPRALAALHLDRAAAARRTGDRRIATRAVAAAHSVDAPPLP